MPALANFCKIFPLLYVVCVYLPLDAAKERKDNCATKTEGRKEEEKKRETV